MEIADSWDNLVEAVNKWGDEHGVDNAMAQYAKINEEIGEIAHELTRGHLTGPLMADAIGDTLVTVLLFAHILGYDARVCLDRAYSVIKERKGRKGSTGAFVKEGE